MNQTDLEFYQQFLAGRVRLYHYLNPLLFDIILNGNRLGCDNNGVSRVGVLSTKTNGMHDIICNENDIVKWNGTEYVFK